VARDTVPNRACQATPVSTMSKHVLPRVIVSDARSYTKYSIERLAK